MTTEVETKTESADNDTSLKDVNEVEKKEKQDNDQIKEKKMKKVITVKPAVHKQDYDKDVVYLYQFTRTPLLPSVSPFCLKVETFLRAAGIKYENVNHRMRLRSKKGLLPFIELNGEQIADSTFIIKHLTSKFGNDMDRNLSDEQRTLSHALTSMIEHHFFWCIKWWRTKVPTRMLTGYKLNLQKMLDTKVPSSVLNLGFKLRLKSKCKAVKAVGLGVHSPQEIEELGYHDLQVLSNQLSDKNFFFGHQPTHLDVVAFGTLAQLVYLSEDLECPWRTHIEQNYENLIKHTNRMKELYFPDWDEICSTLELNTHLPKPPPTSEKSNEDDKEANTDNKCKSSTEIKDKESSEKTELEKVENN